MMLCIWRFRIICLPCKKLKPLFCLAEVVLTITIFRVNRASKFLQINRLKSHKGFFSDRKCSHGQNRIPKASTRTTLVLCRLHSQPLFERILPAVPKEIIPYEWFKTKRAKKALLSAPALCGPKDLLRLFCPPLSYDSNLYIHFLSLSLSVGD